MQIALNWRRSPVFINRVIPVQRKHFAIAVALALLALTAPLPIWMDSGKVTLKKVSSSGISTGTLTTQGLCSVAMFSE